VEISRWVGHLCVALRNRFTLKSIGAQKREVHPLFFFPNVYVIPLLLQQMQLLSFWVKEEYCNTVILWTKIKKKKVWQKVSHMTNHSAEWRRGSLVTGNSSATTWNPCACCLGRARLHRFSPVWTSSLLLSDSSEAQPRYLSWEPVLSCGQQWDPGNEWSG